jgi:hypothetical protein
MLMRIFFISCALIFSGCASNDVLMSSTVARQNIDRMSQLQIGMTQEEVYQIMRYPTSEDQITTEDGCYDIWFYTTKANILGQSRPVARNLTPLIFKNGIFVGMGIEYYNYLFKKTKEPSLGVPQTPAAPPEQEDIKLEKTLTPPSKSPAAPVKEKKRPSNALSMSSKAKPKTDDAQEDEDSSEPKIDEEDRQMLDQEREENFNDW